MTGDLVEGGPREAAHGTTAKALNLLTVLWQPRESTGVSLSQMVERDPTSAAAAQRGDQGCQARLLDIVVIA